MAKRERQRAILDLVARRRVHSQEELRRLLERRGFRVTQSTLSRDLRELRIVKIPRPDGTSYYASTGEGEREAPSLRQLLPQLMLGVEGVDHLLVVRTRIGGAQAVAEAIDLEEWAEVLGTVAGDDTILVVLGRAGDRETVARRLEEIAGG